MFFKVTGSDFTATGASATGVQVQIDGKLDASGFKARLYKVEAGRYTLNLVSTGPFYDFNALKAYCANRIEETV